MNIANAVGTMDVPVLRRNSIVPEQEEGAGAVVLSEVSERRQEVQVEPVGAGVMEMRRDMGSVYFSTAYGTLFCS